MSGILFYQAFEDPGFSFLWSSVVMLTMTALCAKGFLGTVEKGAGSMKLLRSCKLNILPVEDNPKYAFVAMYMVLYMWYETQGFVAYSRALGYPVRPGCSRCCPRPG